MAINGKVLVIGAVLKLDRPFKAATITQMSGLSRQLVWQHLGDLTESGYLEKIEKTYVVRDKEGLLSTLLEAADTVESGLPKPGGFFPADFTNGVNAKLETFVASRTLDLPMSLSAREGMLRRIDETVSILKQMRKYLTTSQKTTGSAQKFLKRMGADQPEGVETLWKWLVEYSGTDISMDLTEFSDALKEAMVEDDD